MPETEEEWIPDEAVFFASPSEKVSGEREREQRRSPESKE